MTRVLIEEGMPADTVFAAAFGAQSPIASNELEQGRAKNRRVEMAPVPKNSTKKNDQSADYKPKTSSEKAISAL